MAKKPRLSRSITESQFDHGYWYATEIKTFAKEIGIPTSKLRKDELEVLIKHFLRTGKVSKATRNTRQDGVSDQDKGLSLKLRVINYKDVKITKAFIVAEAQKLRPGLKERSGVRYRMNRWRESQISAGNKITYGDLVKQYIKLNESAEPFKKVPVGRYINFVADYLAKEKNATRKEAIKAWKELKRLDIPKDYVAWKKNRKSN